MFLVNGAQKGAIENKWDKFDYRAPDGTRLQKRQNNSSFWQIQDISHLN